MILKYINDYINRGNSWIDNFVKIIVNWCDEEGC